MGAAMSAEWASLNGDHAGALRHMLDRVAADFDAAEGPAARSELVRTYSIGLGRLRQIASAPDPDAEIPGGTDLIDELRDRRERGGA